MSQLSKTVARVRCGVFHVIFLDAGNERIGSGSAFCSKGCVVTNGHVFDVPPNTARVWLRRDADLTPNQGVVLTKSDFESRLIVASPKDEYDYAVLDIPEVQVSKPYQFEIIDHSEKKVGDSVAFLGYPLEHQNVTCPTGIISSFYRNTLVDIIQIDASVNPSNSGRPVFDPSTGKAIGIITRRATGLTNRFDELKTIIRGNISFYQNMPEFMNINGFSMKQALSSGQQAILHTLDQIERSANVGIGYTFSCRHLLQEHAFVSRTSG
jgi:S1-C subfamily serine protease